MMKEEANLEMCDFSLSESSIDKALFKLHKNLLVIILLVLVFHLAPRYCRKMGSRNALLPKYVLSIEWHKLLYLLV